MGNEHKNKKVEKTTTSVIAERGSNVNYVEGSNRGNISFTAPSIQHNIVEEEEGDNFFLTCSLIFEINI